MPLSSSDDAQDSEASIQIFCANLQAPRKPSTSLGEMVNYYLKMEPHLFKEAVSTQLERIREEREATAAAAKERQKNAPLAASDSGELVLYKCVQYLQMQCSLPALNRVGLHKGFYLHVGICAPHCASRTLSRLTCLCRRMEEVKRNEQRATVEDLMYASVLEKFVELGVDMMPTLDSITESQETLKVRAQACLGCLSNHACAQTLTIAVEQEAAGDAFLGAVR